jgi:hypothetical protein
MQHRRSPASDSAPGLAQRCAAPTTLGKPCASWSLRGEAYCWNHSPEQAKRRQARQRAQAQCNPPKCSQSLLDGSACRRRAIAGTSSCWAHDDARKCGGLTREGEPCRAVPPYGEAYCHSHPGGASSTAALKPRRLCCGYWPDGYPCRRPAAHGIAYCAHHQQLADLARRRLRSPICRDPL